MTVQHHEHPHGATDRGALDFCSTLRSASSSARCSSCCWSGGFCGALGFWVVSERLAYAAESLSHGMLPGLVLAALAGAPLLLGAAGGALVAAALIALAARDARVGPDTGTAVAVTGLVGLGALLALVPDSPQRLEELLFGDPLGVSDGDLVAAAALLAGRRRGARRAPPSALRASPSTRRAPRPLGLRPGLVRLALLACWPPRSPWRSQGLGALLVLAVLVAPPVAVGRHARTPARAMLVGGPWPWWRAGRHPALVARRHRGGGVGGAGAVRGGGGGRAAAGAPAG